MSESNAMTRHESRVLAFQFLYGYLGDPQTAAAPMSFDKSTFEIFCKNFNSSFDPFAWDLVDGVGKNLPALDSKISAVSANWRIDRMPRVDLTIIRISTYEMTFRTDIPKTVSINEAVEIAKNYGEKDSPSFINGILDKIA